MQTLQIGTKVRVLKDNASGSVAMKGDTGVIRDIIHEYDGEYDEYIVEMDNPTLSPIYWFSQVDTENGGGDIEAI